MKIAIIGLGFVGTALFKGLKDNLKILKVDPKLGTNIKDLDKFNPDIIFICLPTPMLDDGNQDIKILLSVYNELEDLNIDALKIVKSTITPESIKKLNSINDKFIFSPEFLRERTGEEDFINGNLIIFGGDEELCKDASKFFKQYTLCKQQDHIITDKFSASLAKYTINSFLANKVIFFNEISKIFNSTETNESWEDFINIVSLDKRIGDSHMQVPGPDGRKGFGGACFPKDTEAFYSYSKKISSEFSLLKKTISINKKIRSLYNSPTERESEQNISFKED